MIILVETAVIPLINDCSSLYRCRVLDESIMEYIDNKKTMCWSKPDALFADASKEDEHPVSIPSLKDLPKMFNFAQSAGSNPASHDDKNIYSQNSKNTNRNSHVKPSNVAKKTKATSNLGITSNNIGELSSKGKDSSADPPPHPPFSQHEVDESHSSSVYSSISKNATLKDLCAEDKQRIASLIQELGRISADKEKSRSTLEGERKLYESQIKKLLKRHDSVLTEKQKLQEQYLNCFKVVLRYQENVAAASETRVASNEGSSRKVTHVKGKAKENASDSLSENGLVDQDVQTDVSRDEGGSGGGKDKTSGKDVSSSETQTSPILSRSMAHRMSPKVESVPQIPTSQPASLPEGSASHLYPRSHSPPFRQYYDQPPRNFDLDHPRVYSNYHHPPPSVPFYPGHPAYVNAVPIQMHRPDPVRHPYAHYPSTDWVTVPRPFLSQPFNVLPQATSDIDRQVPPVISPSHLAASTSVNPTSLEFATPPLHKEMIEETNLEPKLPFEGGETRFEPLVTDPCITVARGTTPQALTETDSDSNPKNHSAFSSAGMKKVALSQKTMSRKVAAKSNSKTPSMDDDGDSTIGSTLESGEEYSDSTLRHLPSFGEDDSREKLIEIRAALKKEQEKLENRLTRQEIYIQKKEKELRRFAGGVKAVVNGNGKKKEREGEGGRRDKEKGEGGREEDGGRKDRGKENKMVLGSREKLKMNSVIDKSCGVKLTKDLGNHDRDEDDDVDLIASLNCGQSGVVEIQRDRGGGGGRSTRGGAGRKVKSASKIIDLVDSLDSSEKESEGGSWRRPLKSSTMIWEGGSGFGGGLARGDSGAEVGVVTRKVGYDMNGRSSRGERPQDQKKKTRTKTRDVPSKSGRFNNQENELLDEIFFLR